MKKKISKLFFVQKSKQQNFNYIQFISTKEHERESHSIRLWSYGCLIHEKTERPVLTGLDTSLTAAASFTFKANRLPS